MEYIFETAEENSEFERMKLIENAFDEQTKELIQNSGILPGWNCLELGTGAGSIYYSTISVDGLIDKIVTKVFTAT